MSRPRAQKEDAVLTLLFLLILDPTLGKRYLTEVSQELNKRANGFYRIICESLELLLDLWQCHI